MTPRTVLRLARAGTGTDTLRVTLTALSTSLGALAVLAAATVVAIPGGTSAQGSDGWSQQYSSALLREPGLRPGVTIGLLLLTIPVLALAAQCARLGAPARERRLAALRLAGATPRQVLWIAAAETGIASGLGAGAGLAVYLAGRRLAHRPDAQGLLPLPTDVRLSWWVFALVCLGIALLATGVAALTLRRVVVSPFGVVRRTRPARPQPWPGLLIGFGVGAFFVLGTWLRRDDAPRWLLLTLIVVGTVTATLGVTLGVGWISRAAGTLLHRLARRPSTLIAARRLMDDPWSGSRAFGAVLVALVIGAGAAGYRSLMVTNYGAQQELGRLMAEARGEEFIAGGSGVDFHLRALTVVDTAVGVGMIIAVAALLVAFTERIVARRRTYAALVATGVPRATLVRSAFWQALAPAVPAILVALAAGAFAPRGLGGSVTHGGPSRVCLRPPEDFDACFGPNADPSAVREVWGPTVTWTVPVPWEQLAVLGGGALALVLVMVALSLLFLRTATDIAELRAT